MKNENKEGVVTFSLSNLHRPFGLLEKYNGFQLKRFLKHHKIDYIINASHYMFPVPVKRSSIYIYDLVDLHWGILENKFQKHVFSFISKEISKADKIIACSKALISEVKKTFFRNADFVPNGTDVEKIRSVEKRDVEKLRQKYNLSEKYVIGYISNFGPWANLEFILEVFRELKRTNEDAVLLLIGPGGENLTDEGLGIFSIGPISPNIIHLYFNMIDVGILPSSLSKFRHMSFPIKIIEYSAARKFVVSTPLDEVKRLNFPNIFLVAEDINQWVEALKQVKEKKWKKEWDKLVAPYDWSQISNNLRDIIKIS
ncbi:MAG: glycosyltransferase [Candidatus Omnitrophica bacterium]|nr:glycosyltransferase [Candidatus Omnitrophota bacterium]